MMSGTVLADWLPKGNVLLSEAIFLLKFEQVSQVENTIWELWNGTLNMSWYFRKVSNRPQILFGISVRTQYFNVWDANHVKILINVWNCYHSNHYLLLSLTTSRRNLVWNILCSRDTILFLILEIVFAIFLVHRHQQYAPNYETSHSNLLPPW